MTSEASIEFLTDKSAQPLPQTVLVFLDNIQRNSRALKEGRSVVLFNVADAVLAQIIASDSSMRGLCSIANDTMLVVPAEKETLFRRRVKQLGYGIRH